MAKETQSPKVKHASRHQKRGIQDGDKKVTRGKRRGTGIQRVSTGQDLLSVVREERRAVPHASPRRNPDHKPYKQRFAEVFGTRVVTTARERRWSLQTRHLAHAYVKSLLSGDGSVPEGLDSGPVDTIRWHFAMTCAKMKANDGQFAGQNLDWFDAKLGQARKVLERRRLQKVAQSA